MTSSTRITTQMPRAKPVPSAPHSRTTERMPRLNPTAVRLLPSDLAEQLDRWALRREKVLTILNPRAARLARSVANDCRALGDSVEASPETERLWGTLRAEAEVILRATRSGELAVVDQREGSRSR